MSYTRSVFDKYVDSYKSKLASSVNKNSQDAEGFKKTLLEQIQAVMDGTFLSGKVGKIKSIIDKAQSLIDKFGVKGLFNKLSELDIYTGNIARDIGLASLKDLLADADKLQNGLLNRYLETLTSRVHIPNTVYLLSLKMFEKMGSDIGYNGEYIRRMVVHKDILEVLLWLNTKDNILYTGIRSDTFVREAINASKNSGINIAKHILNEINTNYNELKVNLDSLEDIEENEDLRNTLLSNMDNIKDITIRVIKTLIVYGYDNITIGELSGLLEKYNINPSSFSDVDNVTGSTYSISISDINRMVPFYKPVGALKSLDNLTNRFDYINPRNKNIKRIYVSLSNKDKYGDNALIHFSLSKRLSNPIIHTSLIEFDRSGIGKDLIDKISDINDLKKMGAYAYTKLIEHRLYDPSKIRNIRFRDKLDITPLDDSLSDPNYESDFPDIEERINGDGSNLGNVDKNKYEDDLSIYPQKYRIDPSGAVEAKILTKRVESGDYEDINSITLEVLDEFSKINFDKHIIDTIKRIRNKDFIVSKKIKFETLMYHNLISQIPIEEKKILKEHNRDNTLSIVKKDYKNDGVNTVTGDIGSVDSSIISNVYKEIVYIDNKPVGNTIIINEYNNPIIYNNINITQVMDSINDKIKNKTISKDILLNNNIEDLIEDETIELISSGNYTPVDNRDVGNVVETLSRVNKDVKDYIISDKDDIILTNKVDSIYSNVNDKSFANNKISNNVNVNSIGAMDFDNTELVIAVNKLTDKYSNYPKDVQEIIEDLAEIKLVLNSGIYSIDKVNELLPKIKESLKSNSLSSYGETKLMVSEIITIIEDNPDINPVINTLNEKISTLYDIYELEEIKEEKYSSFIKELNEKISIGENLKFEFDSFILNEYDKYIDMINLNIIEGDEVPSIVEINDIKKEEEREIVQKNEEVKRRLSNLGIDVEFDSFDYYTELDDILDMDDSMFEFDINKPPVEVVINIEKEIVHKQGYNYKNPYYKWTDVYKTTI